MSKMIRKQVYIEPHQEELLKRRATELGVTEAELIRQGLDYALRSTTIRVPDSGAWRDIQAFITAHRMHDGPQTGRAWTRDELYEERLGRVSH